MRRTVGVILLLFPFIVKSEVKVAVVDADRVVNESIKGKRAKEALQKLFNSKKTELQKKQKEIQQLRNKIATTSASLSEEAREKLEKELEDALIEFKRMQDDATRELKKKEGELLGEIEQEVLGIIDRIGKEKGLTLIFNKFASGLVFADPKIDITDEVISRYNSYVSAQSKR